MRTFVLEQAMHPVIRSLQRKLPTWQALAVQVLIYMGQMRPASSIVEISTCTRILSIKAVLIEMTTKKCYI